MKHSLFTKSLALIAIATTVSCSLVNKDVAAKKDDTVVATYSGGKITQSHLEKEINRIKSQNPKAANVTLSNLPTSQKELLIKEIILKEAAFKEAKKLDLDDEKEYVDAIYQFEATILQKQLYLKLIKDATTDEKIKAKYDDLVGKNKNKEDFKLGFILLKNKKEASKISKRLRNNPNSFSYYAKTKSLDKASKKNKGVLDYSIESSFPKNIIEIAKGLKKGKISKPFAIADKWGIIKLINKRPAQIKSFEKSKAALLQNMALKAIKDFNDESLKKAKINLIVN